MAKNDAKTEFMHDCISKCMGDGKDQKQAIAICFSKWEKQQGIQSFQRKVNLQSFRVQLSQEEIMSNIDNETLNKIKEKDQHPYFKVFSICHPGTSKPKLLDAEKQEPITWTTKAVQSLKNIVLKGIKFFNGHNKDSSTDNREYFGEVVGNFEKEIKGKLNHLVVGYFPDKSKVSDKDIVSQESIWNLVKKAGKVLADSVEKVTGIAMGNSQNGSPAFSGAKALGEVQCFDDIDYSEKIFNEKIELEKKVFTENKNLKNKLRST
jgi:hypothetical protein